MVGITKKKLSKQDILFPILLVGFFLISFFILHKDLFTYSFETRILGRYLRSQDIPHEVPGRLFLSDSDIHISAGYLYVSGYEPTEFNFQHPPFIKYLYGLSTLLTGNPFWVQLGFGAAMLLLTYLIGRMFFSSLIGFMGGLLLLIDPLFHHVASEALLDLGQAVFVTAFLLVSLKYSKHAVLQGILLGLAMVSKFFTPVVIVWFSILAFQWYKNRSIPWKEAIITALTSLVVLYLMYILTVFNQGVISPVFYQLKMLKYWFHHSVASFPGANIFLFLFGIYKPWWGNQAVEFSTIWSLAWPVSTGTAIYKVAKVIQSKIQKVPLKLFVYLFPLFYLLTLAIQAPFPRYFIVILPWLYVGFASIFFRERK